MPTYYGRHSGPFYKVDTCYAAFFGKTCCALVTRSREASHEKQNSSVYEYISFVDRTPIPVDQKPMLGVEDHFSRKPL